MAKNCKINKIFKKLKKYKIAAKKSCFLRIHDKKKRSTLKRISEYEFIDAFKANMKEKNIWFSKKFANKSNKNQTTLRMIDDHKKNKNQNVKKFLNWRIHFLMQSNNIKMIFDSKNLKHLWRYFSDKCIFESNFNIC